MPKVASRIPGESRLARCVTTRALLSCLVVLWFGLAGIATDAAQRATPVRDAEPASRLLTRAEGRSILDVASQQEQPTRGETDCSHLVHDIYSGAGFEYSYASSYEIYAGNAHFARVKYPRAGDLIAWPGHVGIVVNPAERSFFSLVRSGLQNQYYDSPYWRARGVPRFYRFRVSRLGELTAANPTTTSSELGSKPRAFVGPLPPQRATLVDRSADRPPVAVSAKSTTNRPNQPQSGSLRAPSSSEVEDDESAADPASDRPPTATARSASLVYGPPSPPTLSAGEKESELIPVPATATISAAAANPTRAEVAQGISDWSNGFANAGPGDDLLNSSLPVVIVEQSAVEKIEIKHNHGWARLAIDSIVSIEAGVAQAKRRHDKIRWELRHTASNWEAVPPAGRIYLPHDVAVKNLAAQLARIAASDGAAQHQQSALDQEAQLASLLNLLLQKK